MKESITPHKGGRTDVLHIRIRPDIKDQLRTFADEMGITQADAIEYLITNADRDFLTRTIQNFIEEHSEDFLIPELGEIDTEGLSDQTIEDLSLYDYRSQEIVYRLVMEFSERFVQTKKTETPESE